MPQLQSINIQTQLIDLAREMEALRGRLDFDSTARRDEVRELIKTIGRTAAFFGGLDAMKRLHNACEAEIGNTNEVGDVLNRAWDGISGWWR